MKTQGKNTVLNILGTRNSSDSMMCSFRCDRSLWNDFGILCSLNGVDKTAVLINYIQSIVDENRDKIKAVRSLTT